MYHCEKGEFYNWLQGKTFFDDKKHTFTYKKTSKHILSISSYLEKYKNMEFFFKEHNDIVVWGYFGLILKDKRKSVLSKKRRYGYDG